MISEQIHQGHVLKVLKTFPADSVDCVVTSPPYWGLRDYKIEPQVWDAQECEHEWGEETTPARNETKHSESVHKDGFKDAFRNSKEWVDHKVDASPAGGSFCLLCGAWRGSLGLEPTPELFVKHIVDIFREVRRVLKPTGVCFVNLGDTYARDPGKGDRAEYLGLHKNIEGSGCHHASQARTLGGLKPKDLCGIPWRVAFALQADGWYLRSDIIWSKPNPMPESVTDRPTKSHEYIFLLTKSAKYFWNQEAVREAPQRTTQVNWKDSDLKKYSCDERLEKQGSYKDWRKYCPTGKVASHNIRSVWTFATEPTPEAHFATFPQELVRRCILAGTSEKGCCPKCGKPWEPVVEKPEAPKEIFTKTKNPDDNFIAGHRKDGEYRGSGQKYQNWLNEHPSQVTGWRPTCTCGYEKTVPAVVLDPFFGSGTTGIVAENLYRKWIGIELNPEYIAIAEKRLKAKADIDQVDWLKGTG